MRRIALSLLFLFAAAAASAEEHWFSVHLDGRRIGHMQLSRDVDDTQVTHRQVLALTLERSGEALTLRSEETMVELADGTPLSFDTEIDNAGSITRVHGEIEHAHLRLAIQMPDGTAQTQHHVWPAEALLPEGQRLAARRAGFVPGTQYTLMTFDPGSLRAVREVVHVDAMEDVDVHGQMEGLVPLRQTAFLDDSQIESRIWLRPSDGAVRRLRFSIAGLRLDVHACDAACALAPVQTADVLDMLLAPSPRALRTSELAVPLVYRIGLRQGDGMSLAAQPGQRTEPIGEDVVRLRIDPAGDARDPPRATDTAATRWLQSDDAELRTRAREAVGDADAARERMRRLESFVREHVEIKSLRVGYASALEVLHGREGDCTEHAVLLAAMARALGIPARIATGIAYAPEYAGRRDVFVPHAWVLAWIDGRWQGFDAALNGYDAGHIAFASGDGDPYRFYEGIELLGSVTVLDVERVGWRERARMRREGRVR